MFLRATAKINLALDILGRREDGYHEVRMVMQMVGMYDRLTLTPVRGAPRILLTTNLPYIPTDENNLVVKAAKLLMAEKGVTDGVDIRLDKFIPVAAGLAGGSSDAAMTMIGINRLFRLGFTTEELMERGKKVGADVPYCILRGTALAEGIGEKLTKLPPMPDCRILLCKTAAGVSTGDIYNAYDAMPESSIVHPDTDGMLEALAAGDIDGIADVSRMVNVLEPVTKERCLIIGEIEKDMLREGAANAIMSGSGPTVFGIFTDSDQAEACRLKLRSKYPAARTFLTWPEAQQGPGI